MRVLKILVVAMGVLLVGGFAALIVAIAMRGSQPRPPSTPVIAPPLELPPGARIETMSVGTDRLMIDIVMPDGNRQLRILDLATGRPLLVIPLRLPP